MKHPGPEVRCCETCGAIVLHNWIPGRGVKVSRVRRVRLIRGRWEPIAHPALCGYPCAGAPSPGLRMHRGDPCEGCEAAMFTVDIPAGAIAHVAIILDVPSSTPGMPTVENVLEVAPGGTYVRSYDTGVGRFRFTVSPTVSPELIRGAAVSVSAKSDAFLFAGAVDTFTVDHRAHTCELAGLISELPLPF